MIEFQITPIEQNGQRVLTTAQLAEAYNTSSRRISENFKRNRERFIEGKHFYCLTGKTLKEFRANTQIAYSPKNVNTLYLWTERGALLHAKSLNTDKAWEVYEVLVDTYFRVREVNKFYNEDIYQKLEILEKRIDGIEINIKKSITENSYN
ncbi:MAG: ORF6N domain-containing protein, partial [Ruminococcus sp.]|nr:ORF6N domain-containing protein [Ruminococcus sp.]